MVLSSSKISKKYSYSSIIKKIMKKIQLTDMRKKNLKPIL